MKHLLNLLAAIALLVWGTQLVRTGILRVYGAQLRQVLARSVSSRLRAMFSGMGTTALVQSSTATALILSSFVGQGLVPLPAALAVMLGADIGTGLMAVFFSFDLSWLSPLCIFVGVVLFISRQANTLGQIGRILIGLGLMLLALAMVAETAAVLTRSAEVRALLASLGSDLLLEITVGAALAVLSYSSLALVLLTATLATTQAIPLDVALGLVLGANLGSGLLALITTAGAAPEVRQVPVGNFLFKALGVAMAAPLTALWLQHAPHWLGTPANAVVLFHLTFNVLLGLLFIGLTPTVAQWVVRWLPLEDSPAGRTRPQHLDPSALATPSLAISCAAREALHQADVVETMLQGMLTVLRTNDVKLAEALRQMDGTVDQVYSAIKVYLTKISREALGEEESRRWTDIISFTINMEQVADIVERVLQDIEDKKIHRGRELSEAGMAEIADLHARLVANLRLGMSVFLSGSRRDAQKLLEQKVLFSDLERTYAANHLGRLSEHTLPSIETSSLHIDLLSELKRINSHICSIAYPILDAAGELADHRLDSVPPEMH